MSTTGATLDPATATISCSVTEIIDLAPVRDETGPAGQLDIVEGRSKQVLTARRTARTDALRAGIETVAMGGFTG